MIKSQSKGVLKIGDIEVPVENVSTTESLSEEPVALLEGLCFDHDTYFKDTGPNGRYRCAVCGNVFYRLTFGHVFK